ncbi:MAG: hypothetical protein J3Q66DRAFT_112376 [Benniella sp.]|nr:MAG: hypothetical protein J3Q66DRAFT_112376 [Benniella sp.]
MHKALASLLLLFCSISLLSLVNAQSCGSIEKGGTGERCLSGCCSSAGFCGFTEAHCGLGCQRAFGICSNSRSTTTFLRVTPIQPTLRPTSSYAPTIRPITTDPAVAPTTTITTFGTTTTATSSTPSPKGTYQLEPTGTASGAAEKSVRSTLALAVVLLAGWLMI